MKIGSGEGWGELFYKRCSHWNQYVTTIGGVDIYAGTIWSRNASPHNVVLNVSNMQLGWPFHVVIHHYYWGVYGTPCVVDINTPDGMPPSIGTEDMFRLVEFLLNMKTDNGDRPFSVFTGCMGGHGRTGTMLASLLWYLGIVSREDVKDPITDVRQMYCHMAIETDAQIMWLGSHGIPTEGHTAGGYTCGLLW